MNRVARLSPRLAITVDSRGGTRAASVGLALASAPCRISPTSGIDEQQVAPPLREHRPVRLTGGDPRDALERAVATTLWAVARKSGRTATRSGFSRSTTWVICSAT